MEDLPPEIGPEPLRVGLVLNSSSVPAWIAQICSELLRASYVRLAGLVLVEEPPSQQAKGLYTRYADWDAGRVALEDDPLKTVDLSAELAQVPVLKANFSTGEILAPGLADSNEVVKIDVLDVLLWLAEGKPGSALAQSAWHGLWSIEHGLTPRNAPGVQRYFWEIYFQDIVTKTRLQRTDVKGYSETIDVAVSSTVQGWSARENAAVPYWRSPTLVMKALRNLLLPQPEPQDLPITLEGVDVLVPKTPGNPQIASFLLGNAARTIYRRFRYSDKVRHWFVAYRTNREAFIANSDSFSADGFREIAAPEGHFYADPFLIHWQGQRYLFVEDYLYSEAKARISVIRMNESGPASPAEPVLTRPYHLSYPFVFEHEGSLYMIPETLGAQRIELYRATDAPLRWELVHVFRENVRAVDTTLWIENGVFYFFTNIAERGATVNDDLFLYCSDSLLGKWQEHPRNPICMDVRRSRSAGKLFRRNGKLIRPAQDCSVLYGYACQLNEVEILSPDEFRERPVDRIDPTWRRGLIGTHTINSDEGMEVIDAQILKPKPSPGKAR